MFLLLLLNDVIHWFGELIQFITDLFWVLQDGLLKFKSWQFFFSFVIDKNISLIGWVGVVLG